jgi:hypothetical protein
VTASGQHQLAGSIAIDNTLLATRRGAIANRQQAAPAGQSRIVAKGKRCTLSVSVTEQASGECMQVRRNFEIRAATHQPSTVLGVGHGFHGPKKRMSSLIATLVPSSPVHACKEASMLYTLPDGTKVEYRILTVKDAVAVVNDTSDDPAMFREAIRRAVTKPNYTLERLARLLDAAEQMEFLAMEILLAALRAQASVARETSP